MNFTNAKASAVVAEVLQEMAVISLKTPPLIDVNVTKSVLADGLSLLEGKLVVTQSWAIVGARIAAHRRKSGK